MKTENRDISEYLALPYTIILKRDEEGDFVAKIGELDGCVAHGANQGEALQCLAEVQKAWIEDCLDSGQVVPLPAKEEELPSGRWLQRVPRSLHQKLTAIAKREGSSLNQLVATMLSEGAAYRENGCVFLNHPEANTLTHPVSTSNHMP